MVEILKDNCGKTTRDYKKSELKSKKFKKWLDDRGINGELITSSIEVEKSGAFIEGMVISFERLGNFNLENRGHKYLFSFIK